MEKYMTLKETLLNNFSKNSCTRINLENIAGTRCVFISVETLFAICPNLLKKKVIDFGYGSDNQLHFILDCKTLKIK